MKYKSLFLWPRETFLPASLFKHYVFLGEMAGVANKYSETDIIDLSVENITRQKFVDIISEKDFIFIPLELYTSCQAVELMKYVRRYTNAKLVAYSTAANLNPEIFKPYFDYVIASGFRANTIKDLLLDDHSNIINDDGILHSKETPESIEWGMPLFDKLPVDEYVKLSGGEVELSVQIGCVYNCAFCMEKLFHPKKFMEKRPISEIVEFFNTYKYDKYFLDATTFTQDKEWVIELCDAIKKDVDRPVKWRTVTRIDCLDEDICKALSEAGCYQVGLGIETLSKDVQKSVHKVIKEEKIIEVFDRLRKYNIMPRGFFILGLEGQTKEEIEYSVEFIKKHDIKCRWKEYIPLRKAKEFTKIEDFKYFEKDNFFFHHVEGMNREDYLKLILKDNRYPK